MGLADAVAELDAIKADLDAAQTAQERGLDELPEATALIYEKKGRLLGLIEDLNAAGRTVHEGNALLGARYNKDLLLAARRTRSKKPEQPNEVKRTG